jgi:hypothetical protein
LGGRAATRRGGGYVGKDMLVDVLSWRRTYVRETSGKIDIEERICEQRNKKRQARVTSVEGEGNRKRWTVQEGQRMGHGKSNQY